MALPSAKEVRVILGDDQKDFLESLKTNLTLRHYLVSITFQSVEEGLNLLNPFLDKNQNPADIAFLDGSMMEDPKRDELLGTLNQLGVAVYCLTSFSSRNIQWTDKNHVLNKGDAPFNLPQVLDQFKNQ